MTANANIGNCAAAGSISDEVATLGCAGTWGAYAILGKTYRDTVIGQNEPHPTIPEHS